MDRARSPLEHELAAARERRVEVRLARTLDDGSPRGVDFVSNDYLGLSRDPRVVDAARAALEEHGAGGRAARLLGGGSRTHTALESLAADWLGAEATLYFPSGYQANLGLVGALVGRGDALFSDALNHASLIDAARLSRARIHVHRHRDLDELDAQLAAASNARRRLVLTEGVFSMDGDRPPLAELAALCARRDAYLVVDEAHAAGLLGPEGAGAWADERAAAGEHAARLIARVVTGGKALGAAGALVAGSRALIDELTDRARAFLFTTAAPPAAAAALRASIEIVRTDAALRERPRTHARALAARLALPEPAAAIVPVLAGSEERALDAAKTLGEAGLDVRAVRPPTVPPGTSRLRVVCHAFQSAAELDDLGRNLEALQLPASPSIGAETRAADAPRAQPLFVVGTDTEIGKTVVAAALFHAARTLGPARYWKPVQTGDDSDTDTVAHLSGASPVELLRPAWTFPLPASPHEAAKAAGARIDPARLPEALGGLCRTLPGTRIVVELAGGLLVPYDDEGRDQADWLALETPEVVLVARSGLGTLNHTRLTVEALRARHVTPRALVLVGEPHPSNRSTLEALTGIERIFELPPLDPLTPGAVQAWTERVELAQLFEEIS